MIPRYSPTAIAELFTDEARMQTLLEVELLAAEGLAEIGVVPRRDAIALRARAPKIDAEFVQAVNDRELISRLIATTR